MRVRPYIHTGGNTSSSHAVQLETLFSRSDAADDWCDYASLRGDYQYVCQLCRQPRSTAEVAAALRIPIAVAKVLLGDIVDAGLLEIHPSAMIGGRPSDALLTRVLAGLHALE